MIHNLYLDHIESTYISYEKYEVSDDKLNTLDLNTWIYQENETFYVGVIDIVGKDTKNGTLIATNINIVRPERDIYLVIRNYYIFKFRYDIYEKIKTRESTEHMLENLIIESAKHGHINKILNAVLDNCEVFIKQEEY